MTWLVSTHLIAVAVGIVIGRAAARRQIAKRKAKADELRWMLATTIQHVEDAARRSGC